MWNTDKLISVPPSPQGLNQMICVRCLAPCLECGAQQMVIVSTSYSKKGSMETGLADIQVPGSSDCTDGHA